jgi:ParB-like chromosome segregation protein Spo0J
LTSKENIVPKSYDEKTVNANELIIKDEYARLVPLISEPEYQSIKQSIKDGKQHLPIILNPQGIILDGHSRFKACKELEIDPLITIRKFEGPLQEKKFIIEVNRNRRHLNEFQRIELESKYETIKRELAKKRMSEAGKRGAEKRWKEEREIDVPKQSPSEDRVIQNYTTPSDAAEKTKGKVE